MNQLYASSVVIIVTVFAVAFALAQGEAQAAIAEKDNPVLDTVRATSASKSDAADAKSAPPAWVVSSMGTVARAEAGDAGAILVPDSRVGLSGMPYSVAPLVVDDTYRSPRNNELCLRRSTTLIVLHTTEAPAKSSLNKLCERGEAHYCVVEDGTVYRMIDHEREAFHAGRSMWHGKEDCDEFSIGIAVVGRYNQAVTLQQLDALKELINRLKSIYSVTDERVVCHAHVAYGAPNAWYKTKHRGRKRCGMLFAMPSVRAQLGLTARPTFDPDVRAKRLTQADLSLADVLYGKTDTMVAIYGHRPAPVVIRAAPAKPRPKITCCDGDVDGMKESADGGIGNVRFE